MDRARSFVVQGEDEPHRNRDVVPVAVDIFADLYEGYLHLLRDGDASRVPLGGRLPLSDPYKIGEITERVYGEIEQAAEEVGREERYVRPEAKLLLLLTAIALAAQPLMLREEGEGEGWEVLADRLQKDVRTVLLSAHNRGSEHITDHQIILAIADEWSNLQSVTEYFWP